MKKKTATERSDELRPEYDLTEIPGGVRGKYFRKAIESANVVVIEPDLSKLFPDAKSVNNALRLLANTAKAATGSARRSRQASHR